MGFDIFTGRRWGTTQTIDFTTVSVPVTNGFGSQTYIVRLAADAHCCVSIGDGTQTATTGSPFLPQFWESYVTVSPGQKIAAIRASSEGGVTAANGRLWITELS